jgi:lipocalin
MGNKLKPVQVPLEAFNDKKYYEVYHSHNWFQRDVDSDSKDVIVVTAEYTLNDDNTGITLVNKETVYDASGNKISKNKMKGTATFENPPKKGEETVWGVLTVRFPDVPFQPLIADISGPNYYITKYDEEQGAFRVESPNEYLWILSNEKITDKEKIKEIKNKFLKGDKNNLVSNFI